MNWTDNLDILLHIRSLKSAGHSWSTIRENAIKKFGGYKFPPLDSIRKRFRENEYKIQGVDNLDLALYSYEDAFRDLCKYTGKKKNVKQPKSKKEEKILVLSDFHIPFHNKESLKQAVSAHEDADVLVIVGDYLDCYSVSKFANYQNVPLKEEITQATAVLDFLVSKFPKVIILSGNHEDRVKKYFESRVGSNVLFLVQYNLLDLLAKPYDNVHIVRDNYTFGKGNGEAEISHFTKIGNDFVVGHFERSSKIPLKAANLAYDWIASWGDWFNLNGVRLYLQGHTHRLSKYPLGNGKVVIGETGCLCRIQDYAIEPKAGYSAHLNGYWVVYQKNGITDINRSNFYLI